MVEPAGFAPNDKGVCVWVAPPKENPDDCVVVDPTENPVEGVDVPVFPTLPKVNPTSTIITNML